MHHWPIVPSGHIKAESRGVSIAAGSIDPLVGVEALNFKLYSSMPSCKTLSPQLPTVMAPYRTALHGDPGETSYKS